MINQIEEAYREGRDNWDEDHRIPVHRAISWPKSAEKYQYKMSHLVKRGVPRGWGAGMAESGWWLFAFRG